MYESDELENYVDHVVAKIDKIIKKRNITYTVLAEKTEINVSTLSKILNKKTKFTLEHLFVICKALKIDPGKILEIPESNADDFTNDVGLFQDKIFKQNSTLIRTPSHFAFRGYVGETFYVYFYSTISSEISLISGVLKLEASADDTYCKATFKLRTGKKDRSNNDIYKTYTGELLISLSMGCCYCILMNSVTGEFCFLNFRHLFLFNNSLVCRVAAALTTSSGESKLPTVHRALISYRELHFTDDNDSDLDFIQGQLRLNNSSIIIGKEKFNEKYNAIDQNIDVSDNVKMLIKTVLTDDYLHECYVLDEARIRGENYSDAEKIKAINILRDMSMSPKYNKISPKSDEFFFKYLTDTET